MIIIIISFDIFSYIVGSSIGKNKFLNNISPNKTLEGLIGGLFFSYLMALVYCYTFNFDINLSLLFFIFLIISSSFVGDLIESIFKRKNNIKNSSNILLGHGGFFDRFDSFILSFITYALYSNFLW